VAGHLFLHYKEVGAQNIGARRIKLLYYNVISLTVVTLSAVKSRVTDDVAAEGMSGCLAGVSGYRCAGVGIKVRQSGECKLRREGQL